MVYLWDTAGQEKYKTITKIFYNGAAGIILMFDITDRSSFEAIINTWYPNLDDCLDI